MNERTLPLQPKVNKRIIIMRKYLSIALTLLGLIGTIPLLGACNTVAGVGRDASDAGRVVTHDANHADR
jgi:predicted small secreted protein